MQASKRDKGRLFEKGQGRSSTAIDSKKRLLFLGWSVIQSSPETVSEGVITREVVLVTVTNERQMWSDDVDDPNSQKSECSVHVLSSVLRPTPNRLAL